jgi:O-antigen ligase
MGAQLWFSHRYTGGGKNPHQVAILFCGIAFWHAYKVLKEKKLIYIVLVYLSVFLMTKTYSSTGDAALVLGFVSIFVTWIIGLEHSKPKKLMFIMLGFVVMLCLGFLFRERLIKELNDWINGDSNGRGRLLIWSSITDLLKKSPVWGLGAGTHARSGKIEFHNSYLEIIAATGLVGLSTFVIFSYKLFEKILKAEPMLISIVISMYGYSTGGFAFRRIVYWILTIFALVIAVQTGQERDYRQGLELRCDDMIYKT